MATFLNVETMFYVREKPWHGLGTEVQEAPMSIDALILAGLDWEEPRVSSASWTRNMTFSVCLVVQIRFALLRARLRVFWQTTQDGSLIPGYKVNLRSTDNAALGIVSDRYKVVQNEDAFQFTDDLLGAGVIFALK